MEWLYVPRKPIVEYRRFKDLGEAARRVAAEATADLNNRGVRTKIEAYWGQRGWTFGVREGKRSDGTPQFRRTKEAKALRMWFERNVLGNKEEAKRTTGILAIIEANMKSLNRIGRGLGAADAKAFNAELGRLLKRFGSRSERRLRT